LASGERLPAIVARRLAEIQDVESGRPDVVKPKPAGAILIRGTEGVAVQLARCCRPIPGDPIVGIIRKGQGLEVHMHDCPQARKLRSERGRWIDVEWEHVEVRPPVRRRPSVCSPTTCAACWRKVANAIAEEDSNIQNVSTDGGAGRLHRAQLHRAGAHRMHLACVMRGCATCRKWCASTASRPTRKCGLRLRAVRMPRR
jgi:guanosine-3',5'-bis(diphosphate) 3'-pyrophosphohydrolase